MTIAVAGSKIPWDQYLNPHFDLSSASLEGVDERQERVEYLSELAWLLAECRYKAEQIEQHFANRVWESQMLLVLQDKMNDLEEQITFLQGHLDDYTPARIVEIKYELRILFKQLAGLLDSTDWQSPSLSHSAVLEQGLGQVEKTTYMRTYGSEYVKSFEKEFIQTYFAMSDTCRKRSLGYVTNSGMKAMEVALVSYKLISRDPLPVYFQKGFYFEGISIIESFHPDAGELSISDIYAKLDSEEEIGCLLLDTATTWPAHEAVDLDVLFAKLKTHKQKGPLVVIFDRTISTVSNQLFQKYADNLPSYVVLICVDSAIKYYQHGLDLGNTGCVIFAGSIFRIRKYEDMITHLVRILSATPDPSIIKRLPRPSLTRLETRLTKMARNTRIVLSFFEYMIEQGIFSSVYKAMSQQAGYTIGNEPWIGSILYIQLNGSFSFKEYEQFAIDIVEQADPGMLLHNGTSFGFDTMRLSAVQEYLHEEVGNCALRFSVGTDNVKDLLVKCRYLYSFFEAVQKKVQNED